MTAIVGASLMSLGLLASCRSSEPARVSPPVTTEAASSPSQVRGAAGDADLRRMMAEVASGWQWVDEVKNKAGGTFSVRQYVRFGIRAKAIRGTATVRARPAGCPVTVVARSLPVSNVGTPVVLDWRRPVAEAANSTGGRLINCPEPEPGETRPIR